MVKIEKIEIEKFITTSSKSISKLVKLQSFVEKYCQMKCDKFCILIFCITYRTLNPTAGKGYQS
jgi:hypothetical protein